MTTGAGRRSRIGWRLFPLALILPVVLLFGMVWQSIGEQVDFADLERDGVRYIQALGPLEIALTNAGSAAVSNSEAPRKPLADAVDAVAAVDNELGERLRTQERWAGLRAKIESLPDSGTATSVIAAYGGANDLLLALIEKVRNNSKLIRDPEADSYYLQDGAAQELPEGIVAAARYTDLLVGTAGLPAADRAKAVVDINSAHSDLVSNARDLSDDVQLAVEGTGSRSLGGALLSKLDRFNRSIDNLLPLMSPVLAGTGGIDVARVVKARAEMQSAAADLSAALLAQIDIALEDRLSSLSLRRLLAIGTLVVSVLLAAAPIGAALAARRKPAVHQDQPERRREPVGAAR
ncbi:hypothetical protein M1L60_32870 [Actinoplanes sp. TRM 88003]|uniref:Uncharacterized protein n=1 Tax=Paractinoplanes aksuensis TaxID=2939490 RepID=A0ABT1DX86_9ACTN|nr:hypothetical protein [Actinoplanes aksuensis]MCO8275385.1 hypothetical protein [Actinoplanes aksuensis]